MPKLPAFFTKFYKRKNTKTTSIAFKKGRSYIFFKRPKLKYITLPFFVIVTVALSFAFFIKGTSTEASWYNDNWQYRKPITIENTGSAVTNQQVKVEQDTATLISGGKLQSSCQDIRFTDKNGNLLSHRVGSFSGSGTVSYQSVNTSQLFTTTTSTTISHTVNSGEQLFVVIQAQMQGTPGQPIDVTGVTWNGTSLTAGPETTVADNFNRGYVTAIFYSLTPQVGTYNVVITTDRNTQDRVIGLFNFTGVDSVGNSATDSSITLSNTTLTTNLNTTDSNSVILGGGGGRADYGGISINNGTEVYDLDTSTTNQDTRGNAWYYNPGSIGSHSVTMTRSGSSATMAAIDLLPDPGGVTGDTCNNASTDFYVLMPEINAGDNTIYMYYGNPSADDIADQTAFNQTEFTPNSTTAGSEEQSPGPLVYFKFDEGVDNSCPNGGDACNSASADYNGSKSGAVWESISCVSGSCLYFDDDQDYFEAISGTTGTDSFEVDEFTVSAWVKATDSPNIDGGVVINTYGWNGSGAAQRGWYLGDAYGSDDLLELRIYNSSGSSAAASYSGFYADHLNEWVYVTGVYSNSGDYIKLYINGELYSSTSSTIDLEYNSSARHLRVGARSDTTSQGEWEGFLDEVKFYTYARIDDEIKADYNSLSSKGATANFGSDTQRSLTNGLIHYFAMNDAGIDAEGETITDSAKSGVTGTLYGDNSTGDNGTGMDCTVAGKFGTGCDFDGTDDYVNTGTWNITSDEFAISTWINLDSVASNNRDHIFSKWNASSNDRSYMLAANYGAVSGNIAFGVSDAGSNFMIKTTPSSVVTTDTWYHVVAIYRKGDFEIYVNGVSQSLSTSTSSGAAPTGAPESNSTSVYIGGAQNENGSAQYGDGTVDSTRVYNRALSSKEVRDLYAWAPGPFAHYKFDENTGTTTSYDSSGYGNNATLTSITEASWVPGKYGSAINYDGSADYASFTVEKTTPARGTLAMWVKPDFEMSAGSGTYTAFSADAYGSAGSMNLVFRSATYNDIVFYIVDDAGSSWPTNYHGAEWNSPSWSAGDWKHLAITWESVGDCQNKIYVDGVLTVDTCAGTDSGYTFTLPTTAYIGQEADNTTRFDGTIDDVRLYDYILTESQITNIINARVPGQTAVGSPISSPVGHWKFDEGYGTTANDSGSGGNNGTITNATWSNSGKYNKALSFDGNADYVAINDVIDETATAFTYSAWIKTNTVAQTYQRIIADEGSSPMLRLYLSNLRLDFYSTSAANWVSCYTSNAITVDTWYHVVFTKSSTKVGKFYINGVEKTTAGQCSNIDPTVVTGPGEISAANTESFNGLIDEVKIYNYALTEDEVKLEYNRGSGIVFGSLSTESNGTNASNSSSREYCVPGDTSTCNPPVLEYKFDENTGTTSTYDTSGNGYTGTLTSITSGSWVPGAYGSALQFDGSADYVSVPGTPLNTSQSTGTISAWVKPLDTTDTEGIFSTFENRDRFMFIDGSTFKASMYDGTGATFRILSGGTVDSNWHFLTFSWDIGNGSLKFYVDGVLADSYSGSSWTTAGTASGTYLARSTSASANMPATDYFQGSIDQFIIYDYVRTPAQIAWEYNKGAPIAWYKFDECEGTTIYDSAMVGKDTPAGNNGTLTIGATGTNTDEGSCVGGTSSDAWYNGANGKWGSSISLDGTNDYVTVSSEGSKFSYSNFTYSAWVKQSSDPGSNRFIIDNRDADNDGALLHVLNGSPDKFECQYNSTDTAGTTTVSNDTWYHVVCVADGSNIKIYVNGLLENSSSQSGSISESTNMRIGARSHTSAASYFPGLIDDVRIYNYPLTAEQVKVLYNNGAVRLE